jgi:hypothetical protein
VRVKRIVGLATSAHIAKKQLLMEFRPLVTIVRHSGVARNDLVAGQSVLDGPFLISSMNRVPTAQRSTDVANKLIAFRRSEEL